MEDAGIYARESDVLGRAVQIGIASGRVINVSFPNAVPAEAETDHELLDRVFAYLDGAEDDFDDVPLALTVPTNQRGTLEALRNVSFGDAADLDLLARMSPGLSHEDESDLDVVRSALRENPVPIFIPDHRVRDVAGATPPEVAERLRKLES